MLFSFNLKSSHPIRSSTLCHIFSNLLTNPSFVSVLNFRKPEQRLSQFFLIGSLFQDSFFPTWVLFVLRFFNYDRNYLKNG